jgi:hypothetical protein
MRKNHIFGVVSSQENNTNEQLLLEMKVFCESLLVRERQLKKEFIDEDIKRAWFLWKHERYTRFRGS